MQCSMLFDWIWDVAQGDYINEALPISFAKHEFIVKSATFMLYSLSLLQFFLEEPAFF